VEGYGHGLGSVNHVTYIGSEPPCLAIQASLTIIQLHGLIALACRQPSSFVTVRNISILLSVSG